MITRARVDRVGDWGERLSHSRERVPGGRASGEGGASRGTPLDAMVLGSGAAGSSRGGGVDSRRSPKPASRESRASREASPDSVLNDSSDRPLELAEDLADAARSSDGVDEPDSGSSVEVRSPSPSSRTSEARNGEGAETTRVARFPSVASLGTPRLTRHHTRTTHPFAAPTQTDDERDEDEGDEEEDEAECADDASGSGAFADVSSDERQPTTRSFAAFAPSVSPHPYLPGLLLLNVPGLRLDGPCHRSCCVPNATREWLRAHPTKTPALAPPLAPGGERVAVFGVPDFVFPASAADKKTPSRPPRGFVPCPDSEKMWVRYGGIKNNAVKAAFKTAGFRVLAETKLLGGANEKGTATGTPRDERNVSVSGEPSFRAGAVPSKRSFVGVFNVAWNGALRKGDFERLNVYQRVNHFPGTWELGRKDKLGANLEKARRRRPDAFDFAPRSFLLPRDVGEWRKDRARLGPNAAYILKPPASSRGRGVRMLREGDFERLATARRDGASDAGSVGLKTETSRKTLVQRYIRDPHLLDGYKYDLRVYVALTSVDPLRVFLYREGLVRLATQKYVDGGKDLSRRCMHLTNYSVNVKTAGFTMGASAVGEDGVGFKRSLTSLRRRFEADGLSFDGVWRQIKDIVVKTLVCAEGPMNVASETRVPGAARRACYELYGFDIMLDATLKPWLIEVNTGPSLSAPSALDLHVKHRMVANLFNLVGVAPFDRSKMKREASSMRSARLTGVPTPSGVARREGRRGFSAHSTHSTRAVSASGVRGAPRRSASPSPPRRASTPSLEYASRDRDPRDPRFSQKKKAFPSKSELLRGGPRSVQDLDFSPYAFEALPRTIRDAEGELSRAGEFERCFPTSDPDLNVKYLELFETRRHENALLCAWERHKKALRGRRNRLDDTQNRAVEKPKLAIEKEKETRLPRDASRSATVRSAPACSRLAPRATRPPLRSERASYEQTGRSLRSSPRSTSPPEKKGPAVATADVDALASSLARRLGVTSGRLRDASGIPSRFETLGANRPAFVRDMVRSVGGSASRGSRLLPFAPTKRTTASTLGVSAPLGVKGEGRKKAALPESVLARARRR